MASIPQFRLRTGDLRKIVKQLETTVREIKSYAVKVVQEEAKNTADELIRRSSSPRTTANTLTGRSGRLASSVGYEVDETQYTVIADVGFINPFDLATLSAARVHTGELGNPAVITPTRGAKMLAFPPYDAEDLPIPLRATSGLQLMTAKQARDRYFEAGYVTFIWPKDDPRFILARPKRKGDTGKKLAGASIAGGSIGTGPHQNLVAPLMLFHLRRMVTIRQRIDMEDLRERMQNRIFNRLVEKVDQI